MASQVVAGARHVVLPDGIVATGFPSIEQTCRKIGVLFDQWQQDLNRCILAKDAEGLYAADVVAMAICRQAGKTYDIGGLVFADSIVNPGTTTVWTAHRFTVARETFTELRAMAKSKLLEPHLDYDAITTAAGNECIPFRNGSRIMFKARERGSIRGFTKVRRIILDEAQILPGSVLADVGPTMNHAYNPQLILMGTPPKPTDDGDYFSTLRADALAGDSEGVLYVEFSADADCDIDSDDAVKQANPSYPLRTSPRAIKRLRKILKNDDDWRREGLGIWDAAGTKQVIPAAVWRDAGDEAAAPVDRLALGIECGPDLAWASVSLAGQRHDGTWVVELEERKDGAAWLVPHVKALLEANPEIRAVAADAGSPTSALFADFERAGIRLAQPKVAELGQSCSRLLEGVVTGQVWHTKQPQMDLAVSVAGKRKLGDTGMWVFSRASASSDITPIQAATLALWAAQLDKTKKPLRPSGGAGRSSGNRTMAGGRRGVVM